MSLQVPIELVTVVNTTTLTNPNNSPTGGSITSEACVNAAMNACAKINTLLAPFRAKTPAATWPQLCAAALGANVDLRVASHAGTGAVFSVASDIERAVLKGNLTFHRDPVAVHAGHVPDIWRVDCRDICGSADRRVPDPAGGHTDGFGHLDEPAVSGTLSVMC